MEIINRLIKIMSLELRRNHTCKKEKKEKDVIQDHIQDLLHSIILQVLVLALVPNINVNIKEIITTSIYFKIN